MNQKNLINWGELSRLLSGSRSTVRRGSYSKRHKPKIEKLLSLIEGWMEEVKSDTPPVE